MPISWVLMEWGSQGSVSSSAIHALPASTVRVDEFTFSLAILPHRVNLSFLILQMELSGLPHGRPEFNEMQQSSTWHKASIDMTPCYPSFYMKS